MKVQIRTASPEDARVLSKLAVRAKSSWGYPRDWIARWSSDLTITPEYLAVHETFVAMSGDDPIGVCALELRGDEASLEHVWVDPGSQKSGVGRTLVEHALRLAAHAGVARVSVLSDPYAEQFYRKLGAHPVGVVAAPMPGAPDRELPVLEFVLTGETTRMATER
jgi:N-acetylglutamate synthase-like GNAT family acetyltransferase